MKTKNLDIFGAVEALGNHKKIVREWYLENKPKHISDYIYFDFENRTLKYKGGSWKDGFTRLDVAATDWRIVG